jgi:hypothetical protein
MTVEQFRYLCNGAWKVLVKHGLEKRPVGEYELHIVYPDTAGDPNAHSRVRVRLDPSSLKNTEQN